MKRKLFLAVAMLSMIVAITACKEEDKGVAVTSVDLVDQDKVTLAIDGTRTLVATILPKDATNKKVTWKSSEPTVAEVTDAGLVTAKKEGTATITVTTVDGGKKDDCVVTVTGAPVVPVAVVSVTLDETAALQMGGTETVTLVATILPEDATNKNVTWSSSDPTVADVIAGVVTAEKEGTTTITVTTEDGTKTDDCLVTVAAAAPVGPIAYGLGNYRVTYDSPWQGQTGKVIDFTIEIVMSENEAKPVKLLWPLAAPNLFANGIYLLGVLDETTNKMMFDEAYIVGEEEKGEMFSTLIAVPNESGLIMKLGVASTEPYEIDGASLTLNFEYDSEENIRTLTSFGNAFFAGYAIVEATGEMWGQFGEVYCLQLESTKVEPVGEGPGPDPDPQDFVFNIEGAQFDGVYWGQFGEQENWMIRLNEAGMALGGNGDGLMIQLDIYLGAEYTLEKGFPIGTFNLTDDMMVQYTNVLEHEGGVAIAEYEYKSLEVTTSKDDDDIYTVAVTSVLLIDAEGTEKEFNATYVGAMIFFDETATRSANPKAKMDNKMKKLR